MDSENLSAAENVTPPLESEELVDHELQLEVQSNVEPLDLPPDIEHLEPQLSPEQTDHLETQTDIEQLELESLSQNSLEVTVDHLRQEEAQLKTEIAHLTSEKQKVLESQIRELQMAINRISQESLGELEQRKQELQAAIILLQKKQERLQAEMKTSYAGASQDIAIRVQGFKDYLVGSLQDLVASTEKLNLAPVAKAEKKPEKPPVEKKLPEPPLLAEQAFSEQKQRVEQLLERYRTLPDYYGPAWKLRRTFEATHAERVANWFFAQAGRGSMRTMGTRLQNILVAAATVSVLRSLYGEKVRVLILATSPERLGEWRRGFQDCLGISRDNFGPEKGVVLFEDPEPLTLKGDRLVSEDLMPLVIIDEAEEYISLDLLRFPFLLGFGRDPQAKPTYSSRDFRDF